MSKVDTNGTLSNTSDSEHSDLGSKSNSPVSSVEEDLRSSDVREETITETYSSSDGEEEIPETFIVSKSSEFVEILWGLPIVNESILNLKKCSFGRAACDFADFGARRVSDLVSEKFGEQIEKADKFAAASVKDLCVQVPLLKEPTDKIFSTLKGPAIQTYTTVRQYHEQLGCKFEDNITAPGSRLARNFDSRLTPLVNAIEVLLQKMVPDENGKPRDIQDDQQQIAQILRVLHIAIATRDRCVEKMKKQLTTTQLQEVNQLLGKATETVNILNQAIFGMVVNLRETVPSPDLAALQTRLQSVTAVIYKDEENLPRAVQARIVELSSALLTTTDSIGAYIKLNAQHFPEYLQERLKPLMTFFEEHYGDVANEFKNGRGSPLEKSRNIIQLSTNHTLPLLRDLQESIQCYTSTLNSTLNTSFHNTTDAVKNQLHSASRILNVK